MALNLFSQILKFAQYSIKLIEKLSRRHLISSSDLFVIKGFTVSKNKLWKKTFKSIYQLSCFVGHPVRCLRCTITIG